MVPEYAGRGSQGISAKRRGSVMSSERNDRDQRNEPVERMIDEFADAQRRRLVKRGIELWNRTEAAQREIVLPTMPRGIKTLD